jgi:hypothetical protein
MTAVLHQRVVEIEINMSDITLSYCVLHNPHRIPDSLCMMALLCGRSQPTPLISIRVPYICRMPRFRSIMSWYNFIEGVDIDVKVFTHQANAERVGKPTDFECLSSQFSASTREKCGQRVAKIV